MKLKMFSILIILIIFISCAFYDSNIKGKKDVVLVEELFLPKDIKNKEEITAEIIEIDLKDNEEVVEDIAPVIPVNNDLGQQIVNYALNFVGNPYVYGGNSLTGGTDCSGFTMLVYSNFGISLPRSAPDQYYSGVSVVLDNILPGDLVLSGYDGQVGHAAIYIGNGQLVHALNSNVGIVVTSIYIMPIIDVRRVI